MHSFSLLSLSLSLLQNIQRKMTCADFILNLAGLNDGGDFSPVLLKALYHSIKQRPLGWNE